MAAKKAGKAKIKNIYSTPTYAELLANNHLASDAGKLNLYIDHELPLRDQRRRMLYGTYRANDQKDYEKFAREAKSRWPYMRIEFRTPEVIVMRGYFQSGFAGLQSYLNKMEGFSLTTNVLDAEDYPIFLLKSVL